MDSILNDHDLVQTFQIFAVLSAIKVFNFINCNANHRLRINLVSKDERSFQNVRSYQNAKVFCWLNAKAIVIMQGLFSLIVQSIQTTDVLYSSDTR